MGPHFRLLYGMLWLVAVAAGTTLGHTRWADLSRLRLEPTVTTVVGALLAATAVAVMARALGGVVLAIWTNGPSGRWAAALTEARARRWQRADALVTAVNKVADPAAYARAMARRNRICLVPPSCPTWTSDAIIARETRIRTEYGLDLYFAWPHLLLVAPEAARRESARSLAAWTWAGEVSAWGVLFLLPGSRWWPAAAAGAIICVVGWWQGRAAWTSHTAVTEAVADLYGPALATRLRIDASQWPDLATGREITDRLRKGA
ncbi:hypothetical protein Acor_13960 [Acrocarpospora corrugata]|uniref:Uncharacterized protein n=1 Tax=Acrocarpospora corrugata TaxID=35763 RepID=A0A5M3VW55_9ACTN|nr:hypothetical protein [Acrocarpospora corrugata]GER99332.1 hypothetical protein Acor_13960 [Acrocarpospora corrugata]